MTEKKKITERKVANVAKAAVAKAIKGLGSRGRTFEGIVIRKFHKRITIEFERMVYVRKYERYAKSRTKIHARLPESMVDAVQIGDLIQIRECRPLSKIIHFIVTKKIKDAKETLK